MCFVGCRIAQKMSHSKFCLLALALSVITCLAMSSGCGDSADSESTINKPAESNEKTNELSSPPEAARGLFSGLNELTTNVDLADQATSKVQFEDVHSKSGLDFVFLNGLSKKKLMPESTSGGAGWLDFDSDGWPDLFFPQGGDASSEVWRGQPTDRLFQNLEGDRFADVTDQACVTDNGYGHGVAVGDFNEDGFDDIYVSNVGEDSLLLNQGDGTFDDVTAQAQITNPLWSSSAAWGDIDVDGDLDLYVCNYVDYDPKHPISCTNEQGEPATCHPREVDGVSNVCFINQGDGSFREESNNRGLNAEGSKSLGVVIADFSGDGLPDVFVANDTTANHLFENKGDGQFEERGLSSGCSMSGLGQFQASMGVAFGDYDRNGWQDLYVSHFTSDSNTLYQNLGDGRFTDSTRTEGLHNATVPYLAFGTVMADFDLDGWHELFIANGHIDDWRDRTGDPWQMSPQLFSYDGQKWHETTDSAGEYFKQKFLGRAVASADYDRDGDLDLAVSHQNSNAAVLKNESANGHWLQIRLVGTHGNRRGVGAEVVVKQGDKRLVSQLAGGTSYCASHQSILIFGLGNSNLPCEVSVRWPSGSVKDHGVFSSDQFLTLFE